MNENPQISQKDWIINLHGLEFIKNPYLKYQRISMQYLLIAIIVFSMVKTQLEDSESWMFIFLFNPLQLMLIGVWIYQGYLQEFINIFTIKEISNNAENQDPQSNQDDILHLPLNSKLCKFILNRKSEQSFPYELWSLYGSQIIMAVTTMLPFSEFRQLSLSRGLQDQIEFVLTSIFPFVVVTVELLLSHCELFVQDNQKNTVVQLGITWVLNLLQFLMLSKPAMWGVDFLSWWWLLQLTIQILSLCLMLQLSNLWAEKLMQKREINNHHIELVNRPQQDDLGSMNSLQSDEHSNEHSNGSDERVDSADPDEEFAEFNYGNNFR